MISQPQKMECGSKDWELGSKGIDGPLLRFSFLFVFSIFILVCIVFVSQLAVLRFTIHLTIKPEFKSLWQPFLSFLPHGDSMCLIGFLMARFLLKPSCKVLQGLATNCLK